MTAVIDRLQKLIAHERSVRALGSTREAEAFAERIATLLTEHKLSMTEVEFEAQEISDPIGDSTMGGLPARPEQWRHILAIGVATSLYCRVLFAPDEETRAGAFLWVGRGTDRAAAIEMFQYLSTLGQVSAKQRVGEMRGKEALLNLRRATAHDKKARTSVERTIRHTFARWTKDFLFGYAGSLHMRLTANRKNLEAHTTATGLILRDQMAIQSYVDETFKVEAGKPRNSKTKFEGAINEGWRKGSEVAITSAPDSATAPSQQPGETRHAG